MKDLKVRIGSRLYYIDTKEYVGEVINITKLTVWYKDLDNKITKRFPLKFAEKMLNSFDEFILDLEIKNG